MDNVARDVHRSAARRYTPDGWRDNYRFVFWFFLIVVIYNTHCAHNTERYSPRSRWSAPLFFKRRGLQARSDFTRRDVPCVSCRTCLESLVKCSVLKAAWMVCLCNARARARLRACPRAPDSGDGTLGGMWCDSPCLPIWLLLADRLWCQIWLVIDSPPTPQHHCQLYLVVTIFHDLYIPSSVFCWRVFVRLPLTRFIYRQLAVISSHTLQPREKRKRKTS